MFIQWNADKDFSFVKGKILVQELSALHGCHRTFWYKKWVFLNWENHRLKFARKMSSSLKG